MSGAPSDVRITYIGGPTALIELAGMRFLTDPTFDEAGTDYPLGLYTLSKTEGPATMPEALGTVDAVLLSHDHHKDNLDDSGRAWLDRVERIFTTPAGADRLGGRAVGLVPWETVDMASATGERVRITATPARHGPAHGDRGPVTGFVLEAGNAALYVSGDTVWYEGVAEVAQRFRVGIAMLFLGAATVPEVGPDHLTMTAEEAVEAARAFGEAVIVPLHFAGWRHFAESRSQIERAFARAGLGQRLRWLPPGVPQRLEA